MTIRSSALAWLRARRVSGGRVVTSKYYMPDESWTQDKAWWIQIPIRVTETVAEIHVVCQTAPESTTFRHLRVPTKFLTAHLDDFAMIGESKINLFLTAVPGAEFTDLRGPGQISFARFEQS